MVSTDIHFAGQLILPHRIVLLVSLVLLVLLVPLVLLALLVLLVLVLLVLIQPVVTMGPVSRRPIWQQRRTVA